MLCKLYINKASFKKRKPKDIERGSRLLEKCINYKWYELGLNLKETDFFTSLPGISTKCFWFL